MRIWPTVERMPIVSARGYVLLAADPHEEPLPHRQGGIVVRIDPIAGTTIQTVRRTGNGRPFQGRPWITHFI